MSAAAESLGEGGDRMEQRGEDSTTDLFPDTLPAASPPTMPKPETRRAAILEALRRGERLTHIEALRRGWGWRLAADVFALKELHGWQIKTAMIAQSGANDIAVYWMDGGAK